MLVFQHTAILLLALISLACSSAPPAVPPHTEPAAILQFYASPGQIYEGETASLCYGVGNATSVRLVPDVEKLHPALAHCVQVTPRRDTDYTLIAEGPDRRQVSRKIRVHVKAGPPPNIQPEPELAPKVSSFTASASEIAPGQPVTLCFQADNAERVRLQPDVQTLGSALRGCFAVSPRQTTTYALIAEGRGEKADRRQVTVNVR